MEPNKALSRSKIICGIKCFRFNLKSTRCYPPENHRKSYDHINTNIFSSHCAGHRHGAPSCAVAPVHCGDFRWASTSLFRDSRPKAILSTQVTFDRKPRWPRWPIWSVDPWLWLHIADANHGAGIFTVIYLHLGDFAGHILIIWVYAHDLRRCVSSFSLIFQLSRYQPREEGTVGWNGKNNMGYAAIILAETTKQKSSDWTPRPATSKNLDLSPMLPFASKK